MKKTALLFLILFVLLSTANVLAQTDALKSLAGRIESFHKQFPVEKIHLQFDKPYYTIGDTIWFKAYVVNADQNVFSDISNILYVDLINGNNMLWRSLRLPLILGTAKGDFVLTDSLTEGNYRIRAYTSWMR